MTNSYEIILKTKRGDILDCCYFGSIYYAKDGAIKKAFGLSKDTLFYMRSLAKPLQASTLFDFNIIDDLKIIPQEIAIMSGSHAGSENHIKILKNLMQKHNIKLSDLEIAPQLPLDTRKNNSKKHKLFNNCSGKHLMMILLSKYLGVSSKNYADINHPIQRLILDKQIELSSEIPKNYSFDGCSTPLWAISAEGIIKAYFNLINDKKYKFLINSILKYPDLFGGFNRLDSEIIKLSNGKLFSKVGAGGFVIVYNIKTNESVLIKLAQNNNPIRKLVTLDILKKLNWLNIDIEEYEYNQKNCPVAKYYYEFQI